MLTFKLTGARMAWYLRRQSCQAASLRILLQAATAMMLLLRGAEVRGDEAPARDTAPASGKQASDAAAAVGRVRWVAYLSGAWASAGTRGQESVAGYEQKTGLGGAAALGLRAMIDPSWDFQARVSLGYQLFSWGTTSCGNPVEPPHFTNCSVSSTATWLPSIDTTFRFLPSPATNGLYLGLGGRAEAGFQTVKVSADPIAGGTRQTQTPKTNYYGFYGLFETGLLLGERESTDLGLRIAAGVADPDIKQFAFRVELSCGYPFL